eukprot:1072507-Rhodomonas_salina.1
MERRHEEGKWLLRLNHYTRAPETVRPDVVPYTFVDPESGTPPLCPHPAHIALRAAPTDLLVNLQDTTRLNTHRTYVRGAGRSSSLLLR